MQITQTDPIWCKCDKPKLIEPCLKIKKEHFFKKCSSENKFTYFLAK